MVHQARTKTWYESQASYQDWLSWWTRQPDQREADEPAGRESYSHPDVTVDCLIVSYDEHDQANLSLKALLVRRKTHPFIHELAIPGTFLHTNEQNALIAVQRTIGYCFKNAEDLERDNAYRVQQIRTFTGLNRDPRGQTVSILHVIYLSDGLNRPLNDGVDGEWVSMNDLPDTLAFDHRDMIDMTMNRLCDQFNWLPYIFYALPRSFTLDDAISLRCGLYNSSIRDENRKNFKRKYDRYWKDIGVIDEHNPSSKHLYTMARQDRGELV